MLSVGLGTLGRSVPLVQIVAQRSYGPIDTFPSRRGTLALFPKTLRAALCFSTPQLQSQPGFGGIGGIFPTST